MIDHSTYSTWFTIGFNTAITSIDCIVNYYNLYRDDQCLVAFSDPKIYIDTSAALTNGFYPIAINLWPSFSEIKLFMKSRTRGLVSACKEIRTEVCGGEIINIKFNNDDLNANYLNYGFQVGTGVQTIPVSDFNPLFEITNRVNCPIVKYELW